MVLLKLQPSLEWNLLWHSGLEKGLHPGFLYVLELIFTVILKLVSVWPPVTSADPRSAYLQMTILLSSGPLVFSLPDDIRLAESVTSFKLLLKTHSNRLNFTCELFYFLASKFITSCIYSFCCMRGIQIKPLGITRPQLKSENLLLTVVYKLFMYFLQLHN